MVSQIRLPNYQVPKIGQNYFVFGDKDRPYSEWKEVYGVPKKASYGAFGNPVRLV